MDWLFGVRTGALERAFSVFRRLPRPARRLVVDTQAAIGRARLNRLAGPKRLTVFVTARCTRRCSYCFYFDRLRQTAQTELTVDQLRTVAATLPERLEVLSLTGGEPFLRADLSEIARVFWRENGPRKISIGTNGDLPERAEEQLRLITRETGASVNLQVSVQALADLASGSAPGETLRRVARLGERSSRISQVSALTTISRANLDELPALLEAVRDLPGVFHKLQFERSAPACVYPTHPEAVSSLTPPDYEEQALELRQQREVIEVVRRGLPDGLMARRQVALLGAATETESRRGPLFPCVAGRADGVVFEDGSVAVCENFVPFSSLRDHDFDFEALWSSHEAARSRSMVPGCACTHPCNLTVSMSYDRPSLHRILVDGQSQPEPQ